MSHSLQIDDADLVIHRIDDDREDVLVRAGGLYATIMREEEGFRWTLASTLLCSPSQIQTSVCRSRRHAVDRLLLIRVRYLNAFLARAHEHLESIDGLKAIRDVILSDLASRERSSYAPTYHRGRETLAIVDGEISRREAADRIQLFRTDTRSYSAWLDSTLSAD